MIRIRFFKFTLSLPLIFAIAGVGTFFLSNPSRGFGFEAGMLLFAFGIILQILFALAFACPQCGKSPYAIGPTLGPFALAGKPIPDSRCGRCGYDLVAGGEPAKSENSETGKAR